MTSQQEEMTSTIRRLSFRSPPASPGNRSFPGNQNSPGFHSNQSPGFHGNQSPGFHGNKQAGYQGGFPSNTLNNRRRTNTSQNRWLLLLITQKKTINTINKFVYMVNKT